MLNLVITRYVPGFVCLCSVLVLCLLVLGLFYVGSEAVLCFGFSLTVYGLLFGLRLLVLF